MIHIIPLEGTINGYGTLVKLHDVGDYVRTQIDGEQCVVIPESHPLYAVLTEYMAEVTIRPQQCAYGLKCWCDTIRELHKEQGRGNGGIHP